MTGQPGSMRAYFQPLYAYSMNIHMIQRVVPALDRSAQSLSPTGCQDWQAARLLKPSAIKPVIATLEQALVIKTLGRLSQRDSQALKEAIARIVG